MGEAVIRKLLVPNRGEIAARIARTCREMGLTSVLAHSDDDAHAAFTRRFDEKISLGSGDARETYLNVGRIIDAARRAGADAIHPGYGFLSERAELAKACVDAGIIFVGPVARSIEMMGSKAESRRLMEAAGVPVVPGYHGEDQRLETLQREAEVIGFPILVKASAGGGGKGMKIARTADELQAAIESGKREAAKAFGDDRVLLERYIELPRHVEFQIFGDSHGNIVHMFERDCSVQRRHQKIIEESPAPAFSEELREKMGAAAVAAARAVDYVSAGTVEFILTPSGEFFFLEMNTRLQVEHPVTEQVLGIDLVRAQIEVASGEKLRWRQDDLHQRGHSIELRIYAEDPDRGFLPQTGRVARYSEPGGPGIRVDSGIDQGSDVSVKYDPLLSKLIGFASTREECIDRLVRAIDEYLILGTTTNLAYLRRILIHEAFRKGDVSTAFVVRHERELLPAFNDEAMSLAAILSTFAKKERRSSGDAESTVASVWESVGSWGR